MWVGANRILGANMQWIFNVWVNWRRWNPLSIDTEKHRHTCIPLNWQKGSNLRNSTFGKKNKPINTELSFPLTAWHRETCLSIGTAKHSWHTRVDILEKLTLKLAERFLPLDRYPFHHLGIRSRSCRRAKTQRRRLRRWKSKINSSSGVF